VMRSLYIYVSDLRPLGTWSTT